MKGAGLRLFCLIAFRLTLGSAAEAVTTSDLKTGNNSVEIRGSRSGAILNSEESLDTITNPEAKELPKSDDVKTSETDRAQAADAKRGWIDHFKDKNIALNSYRPEKFASQGQILTQNYLGTPPSKDQIRLAPDNELSQSIFNQNNPRESIKSHDVNEYEYSPYTNSNANQILAQNIGPNSANKGLERGTQGLGMHFIKPEPEKARTQPYSRMIPYSEHIYLHKVHGANNLITCFKEGELHHFWSPTYQCLICACIRYQGVLRAVCASCAGCLSADLEIEEEIDIFVPSSTGRPDNIVTPAQIEEEVTCRPLPSGQPFQNPLHPCQVCICYESVNMFGKADVHIKCQENPQCVLPPDVTELPYIPDEPVPTPYCDRFPVNVLFPHPSDSCKSCQCSVQISQYGVTEKLITCMPNPDCIPTTLQPVTEIITESFEQVSCRPLPSGQPFENPLNPCQVCICVESVNMYGQPDVQITCRESPHCVLPPEYATVLPDIDIPVPSPYCDRFPVNVLFPHPSDSCKSCQCSVQMSQYGITEKLIMCLPNPDCTPTSLQPIIVITESPEPLSCRPLPSGQSFENPLHPCQVCICIESVDMNGQPDVQIKCQDNPQCALPPHVTVIPYIPDVPIPSPYCEKFPLNVLFPHPSDSCKTCQCSVQMSQLGVPEKLITCLPNPDCIPTTLKPEIITESPEQVSCKPLPSGQPFENPLHPCQVCICIESVNMYGQPDVQITCQENPQCVLPPQYVTKIPDIDIPVPSPYCDRFPVNVLFPHPSDSCKSCQCSVKSQYGVTEKLITCLPNPDCIPTESPNPSPWPPVTAPPVPPAPPAPPAPIGPPVPIGPLPGPSPHDSCRPYVPNQPFQHPWDECQLCVCTEAFTNQYTTIEVNCFTKMSCCIEPPFDVISPATLRTPIPKQRPGKIKIKDAMCEYKTFGVEFVHPKDPCKVCTCELQGRLITPLCHRSSSPECQVFDFYPTGKTDVIRGNSELPAPGSIGIYNPASSSQNKAISNGFLSYQNPYGSSGQASVGPSQSLTSTNQWNSQKVQRPSDSSLTPQVRQQPGAGQFGLQNLEMSGASSNYGPGYYSNGLQSPGYPQSLKSRPGYQAKPGAYPQNSNLMLRNPGYYNSDQGYPGYKPALGRPSEAMPQAQAKATASSSVAAASGFQSGSYYSPNSVNGQRYPGLRGNGVQAPQYAQSSASQSSAQASSISVSKYKGRSGNPDDNEPSKK